VRIVRRWNQTGQKWAGEPDISGTFFSDHKLTLWILICLTYLWNLQSLASRGFPRFSQLVAGAIATALATAAITFKLAFTSEDSPELMAGPAKSMSDNELGVSLVLRARIVFIGIALALVYTVASGFARPRRWESRFRHFTQHTTSLH
jgi:ethanolaminephosphotransferase